jgi:hypothetical protein
MTECEYCKADTGGAPICSGCADRQESNRRTLEMDKRVRLALVQDLVDSHARAARREIVKAHSRLNDFLNRGIVPDDLKQGGRIY